MNTLRPKHLTGFVIAMALLLSQAAHPTGIARAGADCNDTGLDGGTQFQEYMLPSGVCPTQSAANDSGLWFVNQDATNGEQTVGRLASDGTITMYDIPGVNDDTSCFIRGFDGNIWTTTSGNDTNSLVKITADGTFTSYELPYGDGDAFCAVGSDGASIWLALNYTSSYNHEVIEVTFVNDEAVLTEYDLPESSTPESRYSRSHGIVAGPDGKMWDLYSIDINNVNEDEYYLANITPEGDINTVSFQAESGEEMGRLIYAGGTMYLSSTTEALLGRIQTVSPAGDRTTIYSRENAYVADITASASKLWFGGAQIAGESFTGILGSLNFDGSGVVMYQPPNSANNFFLAPAVYNGSVWLPIYQYNKIVRIEVSDTPDGEDTILQNAENGATVLLHTPVGSPVTCSSTNRSSANQLQDGYTYPLGFIGFCFDTANENNEVSVTFVTNLKPANVKARKYNSINNTYFDIPGATITETTLSGQPALKLTYTITDNGPLDLNPEPGKITDPVGLALEGSLASTGTSSTKYLVASAVLIGSAGIVTEWRRRSGVGRAISRAGV